MEIELVIDANANLAEAAIWHAHAQRLYWVDINEGTVHLYDPANNTDLAIDVGQPVGTVVPRASGGLMLAVKRGFASLNVETHELKIICDPEHNIPDNRFNDGKCDPVGRFWAGTISLARKAGTASLYCLDRDCTVRRMLSGLTNSNGIAWSADQSTMYHVDTPTLQVRAYDYKVETGEIGNPRAVVTLPEGTGRPDGITIDADGMIWVAHWKGDRVTCWDPRTGSLRHTVRIPASQVTSCAFGGPHLDELYITTARIGLTPEELKKQPHAGGVFRVRLGVSGMEAVEFAG